MKLKKLLSAACAAVVLCGCLAGCGADEKSDGESNMDKTNDKSSVVLSAENAKQLGRTEVIDGTVWCAFSGTGVEFSYKGPALDVTIQGDGAAFEGSGNEARVAVYVNGERTIDEAVNSAEKVLNVITEDTGDSEVTVSIVKLSETAMSTIGISPLDLSNGGEVKPTAAKERKIEFIGDSITCGYGVDDEDKDHHFSTLTEDVTKAYAYKTAQALDADYSMVSISGYGIISGYTSDPSKKVSEQTIPQYYTKLGFSYNKFANTTAPQDIEWDFSKFTPDVVVINLGTNDDSYTKGDSAKMQEYIDGYRAFLETVREKNPDAEIFCTLGLMGQGLCSAVEEMLYYYQQDTGDEKVHFVKLDVQDASLGYAADWHPVEANHEKAAETLTAEIKSVMGW